jgi:CheY-like chemotaxis protein
VILLREIFDKEGIDFTYNTPTNLLLFRGSETKLQQILFILLQNAKDATEGKKHRQVILNVIPTAQEVTISVQDNGSGIRPELADRIFEPFFTTKEIGKGSGLGLGIAAQAAKDLHGQLEFQTQIDIGTTFYFILPLLNQSHLAHENKNQPSHHLTEFSNQMPQRVLVVDDEESIREILADLLEHLGVAHVDQAEDGYAALQMIQRYDYGAVFTDLKMPKMDGATLVQKIWELNLQNNFALLVVTGGISKEITDGPDGRLAELVDGYIYKPFTDEEIQSHLIAALEKKNSLLKSA